MTATTTTAQSPPPAPSAGQAPSRPLPVRIVRRLLIAAVWTVLGTLAYCVCDQMFSGYRQIHAQVLCILGMIAIALTGGVAWIVDERRPHDDE